MRAWKTDDSDKSKRESPTRWWNLFWCYSRLKSVGPREEIQGYRGTEWSAEINADACEYLDDANQWGKEGSSVSF